MGTRIYNSVTQAPALTPGAWSAGWNKTTGTADFAAKAFKSVNSNQLLTNAASGTSGHFTAVRRFVSAPLLAQAISGTVKGQFCCSEVAAGDNYTLAVALKVIKPDGTDRGILLAASASDDTSTTPPEISAVDTINRALRDVSENAAIALSSVSATAGDRLVIEIGARQASTSTNTINIQLGNDRSVADAPEDETSTPVTSWVEFSRDVGFGPDYYASASTPTDGAAATGTADPTAVTPPAGMLAGDLVCMIGQQRATGATLAMSETSGQTWTTEAAIGTTLVTARLFWCTFNGTWGADPSVDFSATTCNSVVLHVFRPPTASYNWSINVAQAELDIAAAPHTITGQTTTGLNPTITLAGWFTADDNTWGTLSGTEWEVTGSAQYRNTSGSDQSCTFAHKIQVAPGATGNVTKSQLTLGDDASTSFIVTFRQDIALLPQSIF